MLCTEVMRQLSEYLDGELDAALVQELERHLRDCQDCRVVVDTTRKTIEIYCNTEPAPLPPEIRTRLHEALARRLAKGR